MTTNESLDEIDLIINNNAKFMPVLFLIDNSYSMTMQEKTRSRIEEVNEQVKNILQMCAEDNFMNTGMEVSIITFGDTVEVRNKYTNVRETVKDYQPIQATGFDTKLGAGVKEALEMIEDRVALYKNASKQYYKPKMVIISDGKATDEEEVKKQAKKVQDLLQRSRTEGGIETYCLGIGKEAEETLKQFSKGEEIEKELSIDAFMEEFSRSMTEASRSAIEDD